jgi:ribonuclease HI
MALQMTSRSDLPHDVGLSPDMGHLFSSDSNTVSVENEENPGFRLIPIIENSICVDASCIGNPGIMEYRGVDTATGTVIFSSRQYPEGTNNIGEFLAIVHALALAQKENKGWKIIYSDSQTAISWISRKKCKTKMDVTESSKCLYEHIQRAEKWLLMNSYEIRIVKWNTVAWGEIPADYDRK